MLKNQSILAVFSRRPAAFQIISDQMTSKQVSLSNYLPLRQITAADLLDIIAGTSSS